MWFEELRKAYKNLARASLHLERARIDFYQKRLSYSYEKAGELIEAIDSIQAHFWDIVGAINGEREKEIPYNWKLIKRIEFKRNIFEIYLDGNGKKQIVCIPRVSNSSPSRQNKMDKIAGKSQGKNGIKPSLDCSSF